MEYDSCSQTLFFESLSGLRFRPTILTIRPYNTHSTSRRNRINSSNQINSVRSIHWINSVWSNRIDQINSVGRINSTSSIQSNQFDLINSTQSIQSNLLNRCCWLKWWKPPDPRSMSSFMLVLQSQYIFPPDGNFGANSSMPPDPATAYS